MLWSLISACMTALVTQALLTSAQHKQRKGTAACGGTAHLRCRTQHCSHHTRVLCSSR